jgi:hypothetical protein
MAYAHGVQWNEQKIIDEIINICKILMIDRFPSREEIKSVRNDEALHSAICRNGGYKYYSNILCLQMKASETLTGWQFEDIAKESMETCLGYKVEKMPTKYPYDLLVNDFVKVDVKCARPFCMRGDRVHTFGINKKHSTCDIYVIYALSEDDRIERTFIIPGHELKVVTMCIGLNSKYNKYVDRWDYFDMYNQFYKSLSIFGPRSI